MQYKCTLALYTQSYKPLPTLCWCDNNIYYDDVICDDVICNVIASKPI